MTSPVFSSTMSTRRERTGRVLRTGSDVFLLDLDFDSGLGELARPHAAAVNLRSFLTRIAFL